MLFKPKFFLDLGSEGEQQKAATIAPPAAAQPATAQSTATAPPANTGKPADSAKPAAVAQPQAQAAPVAPSTSQTTAEAIAAELAAAQASRPAPSLVTFAPDCVSAGGAQPRRRRRGGADLAGFRSMAQGMMRS